MHHSGLKKIKFNFKCPAVKRKKSIKNSIEELVSKIVLKVKAVNKILNFI